MARKNARAPFEVMGGGKSSSSASRAESGGASSPTKAPESTSTSASTSAPVSDGGKTLASEPAESSGRMPLMIRLPQGYAVVAVLVLAAFLLISYFVGHARGFRAGEAAVRNIDDQQQSEELAAARRTLLGIDDAGGFNGDETIPPRAIDATRNGQTPGQFNAAGAGRGVGGVRPATGAGVDVTLREWRQPGLNYFYIARDTRSESLRLAGFLLDYGVDTFVMADDNSGLFVVVGARGFTASALSDEGEKYADSIRTLGYKWKTSEKGSRDLSDLYPRLFRSS